MPQIPRLGLSGISGIGQSSSAVQNLFSRASGGGPRRGSSVTRHAVASVKGRAKKKLKKRVLAAQAGRTQTFSRKATRGKGGKGKYNSAAWMAKIRKMRKK